MSKKKGNDEIEIPVKWVVSFVILIAIILMFFILPKIGINLGIGGNVSQDQARQNLIDFFEREMPGGQIEVLEGSRDGNFYRFIVSIEGELVPLFVSLDGKYMTVDMIPLQ